jgi:O-antigen/teichoic acid export membrane protein
LYVTWLVVFADLASIGFPLYVLRSVAALKTRDAAAGARPFVRKTLLLALAVSALLLLLAGLAAEPLARWIADDASLAPAFVIAAIGAWLFVGLRIMAESLKAAGATNRGLFAESMAIPVVILSLLPVLYLSGQADGESLLWLHALATGLAFLIALLLWRRLSRRWPDTGEAPPAYSAALWPLWGGTLLNVLYVNLPILLLPHFANVAELGQFGVAFRLMNIATVILVTLAAIFGPRFAAAHAQADSRQLRHHLKRSQQLSLLLFAPMLLAFTLLAGPLLGVFGEEFRAAAPLLWILAAGQLVNAATGLVGYLLNMMHRERSEFAILLGSGGFMLLGMIVAGHYAGVVGLTLAYSAGLMLKNLLSLGFSLHYLRQMECDKT